MEFALSLREVLGFAVTAVLAVWFTGTLAPKEKSELAPEIGSKSESKCGCKADDNLQTQPQAAQSDTAEKAQSHELCFESEPEATRKLVRDLAVKQPAKRIPHVIAFTINEFVGDSKTMTGEDLKRIAVKAKEGKMKRAWINFYNQVLLPRARDGHREVWFDGGWASVSKHFSDLTLDDVSQLTREHRVMFQKIGNGMYTSYKFGW